MADPPVVAGQRVAQTKRQGFGARALAGGGGGVKLMYITNMILRDEYVIQGLHADTWKILCSQVRLTWGIIFLVFIFPLAIL